MRKAKARVHDLSRFVNAQDGVIDIALAELTAGQKHTHWMWFVFPQMRGLGRSWRAEVYALGSLEEARAYLAHPMLGPRLVTCAGTLLGLGNRTLEDVFGPLDAMKLQSSMTLFAKAAEDREPIFQAVLDRYCAGEMNPRTLALL